MSDPAHLHWGAEALWRQLSPLLPGISVEVAAQLDSTNSRLIERARLASGDPYAPVTQPGQFDELERLAPTPLGRRAEDMRPCLLVAEQQTHGRGRMGRGWRSAAGASLTFSLALPLNSVDWSGLSLAVGVALAEALDPLPQSGAAAAGGAGPRLGLKWPNDLWLIDAPGRGRKLGGILIETVSVGQRRMAVLGVGLNVLPLALEGLSSGYACLSELEPGIDAPRALARVAAPLVQAVKAFEAQGFAPLQALYARRDVLLGLPVRTTAAEVGAGIAEGVDALGGLRVRAEQLHHIISGEVSVRGVDVPPGTAEPQTPAGPVARSRRPERG